MFNPHRPNKSVQILFVFVALSLAVCLGSLSGEVVSASANGAPEPIANARTLNTSGLSSGESSLSKHVGAFNFGGMEAASHSFLPSFMMMPESCTTPDFFAPRSFTVGTSPRSLTAADFNRDGALDVAVANSSSNSVSVFLGSPTGNFVLQTTVILSPANLQPYSITTADFNGDTIPDLATANLNGNNTNNVSVLIGDGTGAFTRTNFSTGTAVTNARFIVAGDFNGDGVADLVTANRATGNLSILLNLNNGAGGFGVATQFGAVGGPNTMAVGDFNGDSKLDIAVTNEGFGAGFPPENSITVFFGDGLGGFPTETDVPVGNRPYSVLASDLNSDGKLDLVAGVVPGTGPRLAAVSLGDGAGNFAPFTTYPIVNSPSLPVSLSVGDFNNDGFKDLVVANNASNSISILQGNGSGAFAPPTTLQAGASTSPNSVVTGDVNNDGRIDVLTSNGGTGSFSLFLNKCSAPDVTLTKTRVGNFSVGYSGTYTLTVTNAGTGTSTGTTTVTDTLPAGLSFVSGTGTNWTCSATGQDVTCTNPAALAAGETSSITLTVDVQAAAAPSVTNTASVANASELDTTNNTASDTAAVNTPPVADNQTLTLDEDSSIAITLTATDANGDTVVYSVSTNPANGILSGTLPNLTYTPNANFNGSDAFTFKANDGKADSNIATITITVNPVNDAPVAVVESYNTEEDVPLNVPAATGVLANDTDVEGSTLSAQLVSNVSNGALTLNADGSFTYTPNLNYNGSDSFTYKASDGALDSNVVTVAIQVGAVNNPPQASNKNVSTDEDTAVAITLEATDVDSTEFTFSIVAQPANGTLSGTAPNVTYTPNANFNGTDTFTFKARDEQSDSNVATVTVTVNPVNDTPVAVNDNYAVNDGVTLNVAAAAGVLANDPDVEGNPLSATLVSPPTNGTLTLNADGSFSYTPNVNGTDSFTYTATDGSGTSNVATVFITINAVTDLTITQTDSPDPAQVGGNLTYTLTVTNLGPSAATNVVVSDTLPAIAVYESASASQGTCSGTGTVTCNLGTLDQDSTATVSIVVKPSTSGTISNTASVTSPEFDSNTANNSATVGTTVTFDACEDPTFAAPSSFATGALPQALAVADINSDGKLDLATANKNGASVSILLGSSASGFTAASNFAVGSGPSGVIFADFNADGKLDVATANRNVDTVSILLGNGLGGFAPAAHFGTADKPLSVTAGDFNGDGKLDVASANEGGGNVSVLIGNGDGSFNTAVNFAAGAFATSVIAGDFNEDGNLDLVTANRGHNNITLLTGNGAGGFAAPISTPTAPAPVFIIVRDFNNDNNLDVATANSASNNISVLLGNGAGGFAPAVNYATGMDARALTAGDINNDGHTDLVVANEDTNNVSVFVGDGTGAFTASGTFAAGTRPYAVVVGDFTGDGRLDAVTANSTNNVSILINACNSPDLSLTKTHTGDFNVGTNGVYTLTVTNVGAGNTFGTTTVTDTLPTGLTYVSAIGTGWNCSASGQVVTCTLSSALAPNAPSTIELTVGVGTTALQRTTNTASVSNPSDINTGNNTASDLTIIHRVADLSLTQTASASRVAIGNNLTYTIGVRNNGPSTASGVVVTDTLPANLSFVSASTTKGTCTGTTTVTCNLDGLTNNQIATVTITGTVQAEGNLVNTAQVTSAEIDSVPENNSATTEVTVGSGGDLSITQTAAPSSVAAGSNLTYTITINNSGEAATSVVVSDNLPSNTTFVSCSSTGGGFCSGTGNNRTVTFESFADGATATITLVTNVNASVANGTVINNTATVSSAIPDPNSSNNTSSSTATALAPSSSVSPTQIDFGSQTITTISAPQSVTVTNTGTAPLIFSSVTLGGLHPTHFRITSNTCTVAGGIAPGATCSVGVAFAPTVVGSRSAALQLAHNANGSPQGVLLTGVGGNPTASAWGSNNSGQLGNNTATNALTPVQVFGLPNGVIFESGTSHSLALKPDGTVWAWGANTGGQLGDGTNIRRLTPIQVPGLNNVIGITATNTHSLAVKSDGTVRAWGENGYGQLGDGTKTLRRTPVQVSGLTNAVVVSAGLNFSLAVKADGTVWAWGINTYGQLGDGTKTARILPVQVSGLTNVKFVSAGNAHALAVKHDGTVWAWGRNSNAQIGDGTTATRLVPVQVSVLTGINTVAAGGYHNIALTNSGDVFTWGANNYGQLGSGSTAKTFVPIQVATGEVRLAVAAGLNHTLLLRVNGQVAATGYNAAGQLGNGTMTNSTRFGPVSNLSGIATIAAGDNASFAALP